MARSVDLEELFEGRYFDCEIIVLCVRWYLRFKLSSRRRWPSAACRLRTPRSCVGCATILWRSSAAGTASALLRVAHPALCYLLHDPPRAIEPPAAAQAFRYRARLDAVRRRAAVDGTMIDPWHLAGMLEGFRLHADVRLGRGTMIDAACHAFDQDQWLLLPNFDQEGEIRAAESYLAGFARPGEAPLLAAASGLHACLKTGGTRLSIRAALARVWTRQRVLRTSVPLTGAAALRADMALVPSAGLPAFLQALAAEAADRRQLQKLSVPCGV